MDLRCLLLIKQISNAEKRRYNLSNGALFPCLHFGLIKTRGELGEFETQLLAEFILETNYPSRRIIRLCINPKTSFDEYFHTSHEISHRKNNFGELT